MLKASLTTIKKVCVFTLVPRIWRGHVKYAPKFENLPGVITTAEKSSNTKDRDGEPKPTEDKEKAQRIIDYTFGKGEYPSDIIAEFQSALEAELTRERLMYAELNKKNLQANANQLNSKSEEHKLHASTANKQTQSDDEKLVQNIEKIDEIPLVPEYSKIEDVDDLKTPPLLGHTLKYPQEQSTNEPLNSQIIRTKSLTPEEMVHFMKNLSLRPGSYIDNTKQSVALSHRECKKHVKILFSDPERSRDEFTSPEYGDITKVKLTEREEALVREIEKVCVPEKLPTLEPGNDIFKEDNSYSADRANSIIALTNETSNKQEKNSPRLIPHESIHQDGDISENQRLYIYQRKTDGSQYHTGDSDSHFYPQIKGENEYKQNMKPGEEEEGDVTQTREKKHFYVEGQTNDAEASTPSVHDKVFPNGNMYFKESPSQYFLDKSSPNENPARLKCLRPRDPLTDIYYEEKLAKFEGENAERGEKNYSDSSKPTNKINSKPTKPKNPKQDPFDIFPSTTISTTGECQGLFSSLGNDCKDSENKQEEPTKDKKYPKSCSYDWGQSFNENHSQVRNQKYYNPTTSFDKNQDPQQSNISPPNIYFRENPQENMTQQYKNMFLNAHNNFGPEKVNDTQSHQEYATPENIYLNQTGFDKYEDLQQSNVAPQNIYFSENPQDYMSQQYTNVIRNAEENFGLEKGNDTESHQEYATPEKIDPSQTGFYKNQDLQQSNEALQNTCFSENPSENLTQQNTNIVRNDHENFGLEKVNDTRRYQEYVTLEKISLSQTGFDKTDPQLSNVATIKRPQNYYYRENPQGHMTQPYTKIFRTAHVKFNPEEVNDTQRHQEDVTPQHINHTITSQDYFSNQKSFRNDYKDSKGKTENKQEEFTRDKNVQTPWPHNWGQSFNQNYNQVCNTKYYYPTTSFEKSQDPKLSDAAASNIYYSENHPQNIAKQYTNIVPNADKNLVSEKVNDTQRQQHYATPENVDLTQTCFDKSEDPQLSEGTLQNIVRNAHENLGLEKVNYTQRHQDDVTPQNTNPTLSSQEYMTPPEAHIAQARQDKTRKINSLLAAAGVGRNRLDFSKVTPSAIEKHVTDKINKQPVIPKVNYNNAHINNYGKNLKHSIYSNEKNPALLSKKEYYKKIGVSPKISILDKNAKILRYESIPNRFQTPFKKKKLYYKKIKQIDQYRYPGGTGTQHLWNFVNPTSTNYKNIKTLDQLQEMKTQGTENDKPKPTKLHAQNDKPKPSELDDLTFTDALLDRWRQFIKPKVEEKFDTSPYQPTNSIETGSTAQPTLSTQNRKETDGVAQPTSAVQTSIKTESTAQPKLLTQSSTKTASIAQPTLSAQTIIEAEGAAQPNQITIERMYTVKNEKLTKETTEPMILKEELHNFDRLELTESPISSNVIQTGTSFNTSPRAISTVNHPETSSYTSAIALSNNTQYETSANNLAAAADSSKPYPHFQFSPGHFSEEQKQQMIWEKTTNKQQTQFQGLQQPMVSTPGTVSNPFHLHYSQQSNVNSEAAFQPNTKYVQIPSSQSGVVNSIPTNDQSQEPHMYPEVTSTMTEYPKLLNTLEEQEKHRKALNYYTDSKNQNFEQNDNGPRIPSPFGKFGIHDKMVATMTSDIHNKVLHHKTQLLVLGDKPPSKEHETQLLVLGDKPPSKEEITNYCVEGDICLDIASPVLKPDMNSYVYKNYCEEMKSRNEDTTYQTEPTKRVAENHINQFDAKLNFYNDYYNNVDPTVEPRRENMNSIQRQTSPPFTTYESKEAPGKPPENSHHISDILNNQLSKSHQLFASNQVNSSSYYDKLNQYYYNQQYFQSNMRPLTNQWHHMSQSSETGTKFPLNYQFNNAYPQYQQQYNDSLKTSEGEGRETSSDSNLTDKHVFVAKNQQFSKIRFHQVPFTIQWQQMPQPGATFSIYQYSNQHYLPSHYNTTVEATENDMNEEENVDKNEVASPINNSQGTEQSVKAPYCQKLYYQSMTNQWLPNKTENISVQNNTPRQTSDNNTERQANTNMTKLEPDIAEVREIKQKVPKRYALFEYPEVSKNINSIESKPTKYTRNNSVNSVETTKSSTVLLKCTPQQLDKLEGKLNLVHTNKLLACPRTKQNALPEGVNAKKPVESNHQIVSEQSTKKNMRSVYKRNSNNSSAICQQFKPFAECEPSGRPYYAHIMDITTVKNDGNLFKSQHSKDTQGKSNEMKIHRCTLEKPKEIKINYIKSNVGDALVEKTNARGKTSETKLKNNESYAIISNIITKNQSPYEKNQEMKSNDNKKNDGNLFKSQHSKDTQEKSNEIKIHKCTLEKPKEIKITYIKSNVGDALVKKTNARGKTSETKLKNNESDIITKNQSSYGKNQEMKSNKNKNNVKLSDILAKHRKIQKRKREQNNFKMYSIKSGTPNILASTQAKSTESNKKTVLSEVKKVMLDNEETKQKLSKNKQFYADLSDMIETITTKTNNNARKDKISDTMANQRKIHGRQSTENKTETKHFDSSITQGAIIMSDAHEKNFFENVKQKRPDSEPLVRVSEDQKGIFDSKRILDDDETPKPSVGASSSINASAAATVMTATRMKQPIASESYAARCTVIAKSSFSVKSPPKYYKRLGRIIEQNNRTKSFSKQGHHQSSSNFETQRAANPSSPKIDINETSPSATRIPPKYYERLGQLIKPVKQRSPRSSENVHAKPILVESKAKHENRVTSENITIIDKKPTKLEKHDGEIKIEPMEANQVIKTSNITRNSLNKPLKHETQCAEHSKAVINDADLKNDYCTVLHLDDPKKYTPDCSGGENALTGNQLQKYADCDKINAKIEQPLSSHGDDVEISSVEQLLDQEIYQHLEKFKAETETVTQKTTTNPVNLTITNNPKTDSVSPNSLTSDTKKVHDLDDQDIKQDNNLCEKIQMNIASHVGPLPTLKNKPAKLSTLLEGIRLRSQLEAIEDIVTNMLPEERLNAELMGKCGIKNISSSTCNDLEAGVSKMISTNQNTKEREPTGKCGDKKTCPPPQTECPKPECPKPKTTESKPECPPRPPPCPKKKPKNDPPPCPKKNPPKNCPPPPPVCPPEPKKPPSPCDPCAPPKQCCMGTTDWQNCADVILKETLTFLNVWPTMVDNQSNPGEHVCQPGISGVDIVQGTRGYEPWTPIPSWPFTKKISRQKECHVPPRQTRCHRPMPSKDLTCKPKQCPCRGFPKRQCFSSLTDTNKNTDVE